MNQYAYELYIILTTEIREIFLVYDHLTCKLELEVSVPSMRVYTMYIINILVL